jgi:DNA-binding CsgD family transcriptional regulator|nr:hypothetical protein [uncultured Psychroserpens sp.]
MNIKTHTIKEDLINTILSSNSLQMDWNLIKDDFNSIYPNFFSSILIKDIKLSNKEEQLLILETLHFNTNTIAKVLGILPESVYTSRYRLNKRLNTNNTH